MGSASSSPHQDSSDDPWWPIENQDLSLKITPLQTMDSEGNSNNSETDLRNNTEHSQRGSSSIELNDINTLNLNKSEENSEKMSKNTSESDFVSADSSASTSSHSSITEKDKFETITAKRSHLKSSQSLDEFKEELRIKREMRKGAIAELHNEIKNLRKQLAEEKEMNKKLLDEKNGTKKIDENVSNNVDVVDSSNSNVALRSELANVQLALQEANTEILDLTNELSETKKQANTLKEVAAVSKQMVEIREEQLIKLKAKLTEIESSLAEREMQLMSQNLRQEYDRQLTNIRNLRQLYEERARVNAAERENLNRRLETSRLELSAEVEKNKNLEEHVTTLENDLQKTSTELFSTRDQLSYYKVENKGLHEEMTVINQLFGQLLGGFSGRNDIDIDKLSNMLEENRELLNDMTSRESCKEGAAQLPKLLFDLVSQAGDTNEPSNSEQQKTKNQEPEKKQPILSSAQDIIQNLPKVWKVLIELLNHQKIDPVDIKENSEGEDCYKSVQTPTGPQMVLSVSKTYIKLKDLILEKKFLQKETHKLKNLNSHLEHRLGQQEKRLGAVTIELNKTWTLVGRMQRQHRQLHTHEQVLRYQLQQKRRLLGELKEELEYCRRKWNQAKEKNKESQIQWDSLRLEFSKRKEQDANTSAESGYSDGPASEDDDEEEETLPRPSTPKFETKRKGNKEKFLLKVDSNDKRGIRIHSVSPIRCVKPLNLLRRNSESQITQFASETVHPATATVQPVEYTLEKIEHVSFNIQDIVRLGSSTQKMNQGDQVKITKPVLKNSSKPGPSNAKKLIESKCSDGSRPKMCCEIRKKNATKPSEQKTEESLEDMFMRLSGQSGSGSGSTSSANQQQGTVSSVSREKTDDEKRAERAVRMQKLEQQCKSLIAQVMRTSNKNEALSRQIDNVKNRHTTNRERTPPQIVLDNKDETDSETIVQKTEGNECAVAGSSVAAVATLPPKKTDEECLSAREVEYTSKRTERLKRLEEGYKEFLNKMNKSSKKADNVTKQVDNLHQRFKKFSGNKNDSENSEEEKTSSESIENNLAYCDADTSNSSSENQSNIEGVSGTSSTAASTSTEEGDMTLLTPRELEYVTKRNERLKRLEAESKAFIDRLQKKNERIGTFSQQLDTLQANETTATGLARSSSAVVPDSEQNLNNITEGSQNLNSDEKDMALLTKRELEYTSKRDERLKRLEAESKAFLNRLHKRNEKMASTSSPLNNSEASSEIETSGSESVLNERSSTESNVDTLSMLSEEEKISSESADKKLDNFDANISVPSSSNEDEANIDNCSTTLEFETASPSASTEEKDLSLLTARELEYTSKRDERLKRLEEESKAFLDRLHKRNEKMPSTGSQPDNSSINSENDSPSAESVLTTDSNLGSSEERHGETNTSASDSEQNLNNDNEDTQNQSTDNDVNKANN